MKKIIFIIILLLLNINLSYSNEGVLFSINDRLYTTIDLEKKINYFLLINNLDKSEEVYKKYYKNKKEELIEEIIINEFIKEKNIAIKDKDINDTYTNLINYIANGNIEEFKNLIKKYRINNDDIIIRIKFEISKEILNQMILNEVLEKNKNKEILNIENYIQYKIDNIILYKKNLSKEEFLKQKNYIKKIINETSIDRLIEISKNNNYNINYHKDKIINLEYFNNELIELFHKKNLNEIFTYENNEAFYIFEKRKKIYPNVNMNYSFIQISSNKKNVLNEYYNQSNLCSHPFPNDNNDNIQFQKYDNVNYHDLNENVFSNLNLKNNKAIIKLKNNINHLIIICDINYDKNLLKEHIKNKEFNEKIDNQKNELIKKLKNKYKLINYN